MRTTSLLPQDGVTDSTELHSFQKKKRRRKKKAIETIAASDTVMENGRPTMVSHDWRTENQDKTKPLPDIKTQGQGDDGPSST